MTPETQKPQETQKTQIETTTGWQFSYDPLDNDLLATTPAGDTQHLFYDPPILALFEHALSLQKPQKQPHIPLSSPISPETRAQRLLPLLQEALALCPPNLPLEDWIHSSLEALGLRPEKKENR